jgi:Domain of unknown function (DUF4126)
VIDFATVARVAGLGSASGTRAGVTLLALGLMARFQSIAPPAGLGWIASAPALGGFAALALVELLAERDDDVADLLAWVQYGTRGLCGAVAALAAAAAAKSGWHPPTWAMGAAGAAFAIATQGARRRLHAILLKVRSEAFDPRRWLARIEEGGAIGLAVASLAAPLLVAALIAAGVAAAGLAWLVARAVEQGFRRPCPVCGKQIRGEASKCAKCGAEVEVARVRDLRLAGTARDRVANLLKTFVKPTEPREREREGERERAAALASQPPPR